MGKLNVSPIRKKSTTKEIIYKELKEAILNGKIDKNEIFTETVLAESLNTSRTPVREAVGDLVKDGLLVPITRKGLKVREVTDEEKEQLVFLRESVETQGIKKLAPIVTDPQIRLLEEILDSQKEAMNDNDRILFIELDQKFHRSILEFAGQNLLSDIFQNVYNLTRLIGHKALMKEGRMIEVLEEHSRIVESLQSHDTLKAVEMMQYHLKNTSDIVKVIEKR